MYVLYGNAFWIGYLIVFTMSSLKDLVELGKQFGDEGETLRKFVQEEQARERDQRVKERDIEREKKRIANRF